MNMTRAIVIPLNMLHNFSQSMPFSHNFMFRAFIIRTHDCAYSYVITIFIDSYTNTWFLFLSKIFHWMIGTQPHRRCAPARFSQNTTKNSIDQFDCTGWTVRTRTLNLNAMEKLWRKWFVRRENGNLFFLGANSMRWSLPEGLFETGYETHTKDSLARAKSLGVICYYCVWVIGCAKRRCTYAMCGIWTEEITSAGDVMKEKYKWNRLDVVDVLDLRYARRAKHIHITNHESRHLNICPCVDGINESWLY